MKQIVNYRKDISQNRNQRKALPFRQPGAKIQEYQSIEKAAVLGATRREDCV